MRQADPAPGAAPCGKAAPPARAALPCDRRAQPRNPGEPADLAGNRPDPNVLTSPIRNPPRPVLSLPYLPTRHRTITSPLHRTPVPEKTPPGTPGGVASNTAERPRQIRRRRRPRRPKPSNALPNNASAPGSGTRVVVVVVGGASTSSAPLFAVAHISPPGPDGQSGLALVPVLKNLTA